MPFDLDINSLSEKVRIFIEEMKINNTQKYKKLTNEDIYWLQGQLDSIFNIQATSTSTTISPITYNPTFWFDASVAASMMDSLNVPVSNGGTVALWKDQSTNNNNAQSLEPSEQPTYYASSHFGKPCVYFDSLRNMYVPPIDLNGDCTFFIVMSSTPVQGTGVVAGSLTNTNSVIYSQSIQIQLCAPSNPADNAIEAINKRQTAPRSTSSVLANTVYPQNQVKTYTVSFTKPQTINGTNYPMSIKVWENGVLMPTYNNYNYDLSYNFSDIFYLGVGKNQDTGATSSSLNGGINEIIFYNSTLTTDQINSLNVSLDIKWASSVTTTTTIAPTRKIQQVKQFIYPSLILTNNIFTKFTLNVNGIDATKKIGKQLIKRYGESETFVTAFDNYLTSFSLNNANINNFSSLNILMVPPNGKGKLLLGNNGNQNNINLDLIEIVSEKTYSKIYDSNIVGDPYNSVGVPQLNPEANKRNIFTHSEASLSSSFPYPAPIGPYANGFSNLMLSGPDNEINGPWTFYIWDNVGNLSGSINSFTLTIDAYEGDSAIGAITDRTDPENSILAIDAYGGVNLPKKNGPYPFTCTPNLPPSLSGARIVDTYFYLRNFQLEHWHNIRLLAATEIEKNTVLLTSGNGGNSTLENNFSFYANPDYPAQTIANNVCNGADSLFYPIPTSSVSPIFDQNYPIKTPTVPGFSPPIGYPPNYLYPLPYGIETTAFNGSLANQKFYLWGYDLIETSNGAIFDPLIIFLYDTFPSTTTTTTIAPVNVNYNFVSGSNPNSGPEFGVGVKNDHYFATSDFANFAETNLSVQDPSGFLIQSGTIAGTNSQITINGEQQSLLSTNTGTASGQQYVVLGSNNGIEMSGLTGEILLYSGNLDPAQQGKILGYLSEKWNIPIAKYPSEGALRVFGKALVRFFNEQTFVSDPGRSLFLYGKKGSYSYISSDNINVVQSLIPEAVPTKFNIYYGVYSNVLSSLYENGAQLPVGSTNVGNNNLSGPLYFGSNPNFPQYNYTGATGEYILYNRALSDSEIADVVGYLSRKWNVPLTSYLGRGNLYVRGSAKINSRYYISTGSLQVYGSAAYKSVLNYVSGGATLRTLGGSYARKDGLYFSYGIIRAIGHGVAITDGPIIYEPYISTGRLVIYGTNVSRYKYAGIGLVRTQGRATGTQTSGWLSIGRIITNGESINVWIPKFIYTAIRSPLRIRGYGTYAVDYKFVSVSRVGSLQVRGSATGRAFPLKSYAGSGLVRVFGNVIINSTPNYYIGSGQVIIGGAANSQIFNYDGSGSVLVGGSARYWKVEEYAGSGTLNISGGISNIKVVYFISLPIRFVVNSITVVTLPIRFNVGSLPIYGYRFVGSCNSNDCLNCNPPSDTARSTCVNTYNLYAFGISVNDACQALRRQHWNKSFYSVAKWSIPTYGNAAARLAIKGEIELNNGYWIEEQLCNKDNVDCAQFCVQSDVMTSMKGITSVEVFREPGPLDPTTTPLPGPCFCSPPSCVYTWLPSQGRWILTTGCGELYTRFTCPCECTGSMPINPPPRPYVQTTVSYPCRVKVPTTLPPPPTTTPPPNTYASTGTILFTGGAIASATGTIPSYTGHGSVRITGRSNQNDRYTSNFTAISTVEVDQSYIPPLVGLPLTEDTTNNFSSLCGCQNLPNKLVLTHNLIQEYTDLALFLYRNNITYTENVTLTASLPLNGYSGVQTFAGRGIDDTISEEWIITFDLICLRQLTLSGENVYELDVTIKKRVFKRETNATKVSVYLPQSYVCSANANKQMNFAVKINTQTQTAIAVPNKVVDNTVVNDQLEFFQQGNWTSGLTLNISVSIVAQNTVSNNYTQGQLITPEVRNLPNFNIPSTNI